MNGQDQQRCNAMAAREGRRRCAPGSGSRRMLPRVGEGRTEKASARGDRLGHRVGFGFLLLWPGRWGPGRAEEHWKHGQHGQHGQGQRARPQGGVGSGYFLPAWSASGSGTGNWVLWYRTTVRSGGCSPFVLHCTGRVSRLSLAAVRGRVVIAGDGASPWLWRWLWPTETTCCTKYRPRLYSTVLYCIPEQTALPVRLDDSTPRLLVFVRPRPPGAPNCTYETHLELREGVDHGHSYLAGCGRDSRQQRLIL